MFGGRLREELGLTQQQQEKLRTMGREMQRNAIRRRADLEIKQMELEDAMRGEKPDRAAVDRLVREIGDLRTQEMKSHVDMRLGFQDTLTPEQRTRLRNLARDRGGRDRGMRAPGPGGQRPQGNPQRPQGAPRPAPPQ